MENEDKAPASKKAKGTGKEKADQPEKMSVAEKAIKTHSDEVSHLSPSALSCKLSRSDFLVVARLNSLVVPFLFSFSFFLSFFLSFPPPLPTPCLK